MTLPNFSAFVALWRWEGFWTILQQEYGMDATAELTETPASKKYTSRPGALIWFFQKSRDRWKGKHQDLKATVKGFKNQIAAVTKSREQWRLKAEQASERISALESEVKELHAQTAASVDKKKRTREEACSSSTRLSNRYRAASSMP
jgi:hypothetical protein